jgi:hypothetical protein
LLSVVLYVWRAVRTQGLAMPDAQAGWRNLSVTADEIGETRGVGGSSLIEMIDGRYVGLFRPESLL